MTLYAYDIECLKNFFSATFVNVEDKEEMHVFYCGFNYDNIEQMKKFLSNEITLIGYNNHSYDDPMIRFAMKYKGESLLEELYNLSGRLVDDMYRQDNKLLELRYPKANMFPWKSIDLMRIMAFDKLGISLKQVAINLGWYKIQDMPVEHGERIKEEQAKSVLQYNLNDTLITDRLYKNILPLIEMRRELSKVYHVDLTSASDSRMANLILENIYGNEMKMDIRTIRDMRTPRDRVLLGNCIAKFVKFQTPQLQELYQRIASTMVYNYNGYKYSEKVYFANCTFNLGIGGLHTEDEPGKFRSDDEYLIQDMDVASYYPNLVINNKFYPKHLGEDFITVLKKITAERMEAKRSGNKVKADGLKITINSIFGKMGSNTFWLEDEKQMLSTTVSGQLGLLMLVEDLQLNGIEVISANTDGVVCKIKRNMLDLYYEIAHRWEKAANLELEYTPYKLYVRRDVNSYITEKEEGSTKEKGAFLKEVDLKKAYHMPIVAKSLHNYFINNVPVRKTLEDCRDIMQFCISQKTGSDFVSELHTGKNIEVLQKTNRFYITKKGGSFLKRHKYNGRLIGLHVGRQVRILNDFNPDTPFEEYQVDYSFYEKEVMKIVDAIEPPQKTLFDMEFLDRGKITKATSGSPTQHYYNEENLNVSALNKLGRIQFMKKIESIVENYHSINGISPRYVYVRDVDVRNMVADVYCLAKAVNQQIGINKAAYRKNKIEPGMIIYCNKFSKLEYGHEISDYRITEKIESEVPELGLTN
jgi:hypothetical protein